MPLGQPSQPAAPQQPLVAAQQTAPELKREPKPEAPESTSVKLKRKVPKHKQRR